MNDIGIFQIDGCFQLKLEDGDLAGDEGLETSVIISLFSNRRVSEGELPVGIDGKEGWWGDMFAEIEGDQIGSKLWLVDRGKTEAVTLAAMENHIAESLEWMIDDGVAASVTVLAEFDSKFSAIASIAITRPTGETDRFGLNWDAQELVRA